ncbi:aspartate--tRNA ligase dps1 [Friedmanniomyces endolithicus]|nr:aspartate--tRNA ligase dps1 [Friedmanniomyces endolithicus]
MVADALIYHPAVSHYNRFVATTAGRDKTLRTVQYFSRFLAWYTYRTNSSAATVAFFQALMKNFGSVRKALRLGKFVEHFKAAAVAADSKPGSIDPVVKYLAVGRQLGYAFYIALDNLAYFDQTGVRKFDGAVRVQKEAYRAWLAGLACNIVAGTYQLYNLRVAARKQRDGQDAEKAVEAKKLERDQRATQIQLISDLCDSIAPCAALGFGNFDDGIVGLAGTTSSLIGLFATWAKTAAWASNPAIHDSDLQRKCRHAEKEGVKIHDIPLGTPVPMDIRAKIDQRVQDWLHGRKGKQVHLTDVHPWQDMPHRQYHYSTTRENQIAGLVILAQLSPDHGWQVKFSLDFPGAPSGAIELLVLHALKACAVAGAPSVTFGGGATSAFKVGHNMRGARVKVLSKAYHAVANELHLTNKSEFREKLGAVEDPIYICYPPHGLGPSGARAILSFFEDDDDATGKV